MVGKYDIVHIQLFACIVKGNDPAPLVRNLMSLLSKCGKVTALPSASSLVTEERGTMRREVHRLPSNLDCACRLIESSVGPGGYLQWNDVDIDAQRLVSLSESSQSTTKPTHDMMALMAKPRNSSVFKYVENNASFSIFLNSVS